MTTLRSFRWGLALAALPLCILLASTAHAREVPPESSDRTDALFRVGMAALAEAEQSDDKAARRQLYDRAIAAFRLILVNRPDLVRVRLELARTFYLKGQYDLARRHFELVLAGGVPPPVVANIRAFLDAMQTRKRFTGYFGAAVAPDSNLNAASESEIIYIDTVFGRLPFQRQGDVGAQSGLGLSVWGGGEYQHPLGERLRLRVGADAAQREYSGGDFDQFFLAAHAGPRWLADPMTEFSLLGTAQRQWLGGSRYADETGVRLELDRRLTRGLWARGTAAARERDHLHDILDGPITDFTLSLAWTPAPVLRVQWMVGYERSHAASEHWRNLSRWVRVGTSLALPLGFTLGTSVQMRRTQYDGSGQAHLTLHARPAALRPHPHGYPVGAQPRRHAAALQPAAGARARSAGDERPGAGLRTQPRRVAVCAAVLSVEVCAGVSTALQWSTGAARCMRGRRGNARPCGPPA